MYFASHSNAAAVRNKWPCFELLLKAALIENMAAAVIKLSSFVVQTLLQLMRYISVICFSWLNLFQFTGKDLMTAM